MPDPGLIRRVRASFGPVWDVVVGVGVGVPELECAKEGQADGREATGMEEEQEEEARWEGEREKGELKWCEAVGGWVGVKASYGGASRRLVVVGERGKVRLAVNGERVGHGGLG